MSREFTEMAYRYLEGGCFVVDPDCLGAVTTGNWSETPVITRNSGALAVSQYLVQVGSGPSPVRAYPGSDCVLFVVNGTGSIAIGHRIFAIGPDTGIYVRPDEVFEIRNTGDGSIKMVLNVCPECAEPLWLDSLSDNFNLEFPERTERVDASKRKSTADRFYQVLIGPRHGSSEVTQFVGTIPESRAPEHFHQYEEVITVLRGEGSIWTGSSHAPISPGSMIYLPREQPHCIECTVACGLELLGLFYPAGSPAVRY